MADEPQGTLFGDAADVEGVTLPAKVRAPGVARVLMPNRTQEEARAQVQALKQQREENPGAVTRRQQAARERAALERLPELAKLKVKQGKKPEDARASTTDAEAPVMKMADGGFRPASNAQYATDTQCQVIVGVDAVTIGSDMGQLVPMVEQVGERCAQHPAQWCVDGGYPAHEQLDQAGEHTVVYAPVPKPKSATTDQKSMCSQPLSRRTSPRKAPI